MEIVCWQYFVTVSHMDLKFLLPEKWILEQFLAAKLHAAVEVISECSCILQVGWHFLLFLFNSGIE